MRKPTLAERLHAQRHGPPAREKWKRVVKDQVAVPDEMLRQEASIVWTPAAMRLKPRYVRWAYWTDNTLANPPKFNFPNSKRVVQLMGYSTLRPGHAGDLRRLFFIGTAAYDLWQFDGMPSESVDPLTVFAGYRGRRTAKARTYVAPGRKP